MCYQYFFHILLFKIFIFPFVWCKKKEIVKLRKKEVSTDYSKTLFW